MTHYDYKVVPAPKRAKRVKGVHGSEELFALTLTEAINEVARQGWEYVRAEHLPAEAPRGWFRGRSRASRRVLVFRRPREQLGPRLAAVRPEPAPPTRPRRPAAAPTPAAERAVVDRLQHSAPAPRAAGAPARAAGRRGRGSRRDAAAPGAAARAGGALISPGGSAARSSASACTPPASSSASTLCTARLRSTRLRPARLAARITTRKCVPPPSRQPPWPRCCSLSSITSRWSGAKAAASLARRSLAHPVAGFGHLCSPPRRPLALPRQKSKLMRPSRAATQGTACRMSRRSPFDFDISVTADKKRRARGARILRRGRDLGAGLRAAGLHQARQVPGAEVAGQPRRFPLVLPRPRARVQPALELLRSRTPTTTSSGSSPPTGSGAARRGRSATRRTATGTQPHAEGRAWQRFGFDDPMELLGDKATLNPGGERAARPGRSAGCRRPSGGRSRSSTPRTASPRPRSASSTRRWSRTCTRT